MNYNKVATGQVRFKPMSEADWSAFQGADSFKNGDRPHVAGLLVGDVEYIFVAAGNGLVVHWSDETEDRELLFAHEIPCSHKAIRLFRVLLGVAADPGDLVDLGFVEVH